MPGPSPDIPSPGGLSNWSIRSGSIVSQMPLKPNGGSRDGAGQRKRLLSAAIFHRCNYSPSAGRHLNSDLVIPHPEERPHGRVSKDGSGLSWFETALKKRL